MKTTTRSTTTYTIPGTDLDVILPIEPSSIMQYKEPLVHIGETIVLGYLADDSDTENPCGSDDFFGRIYECRRHSKTLREYEKALGLRDGGPDLDLVPEEIVVAEAHSRITESETLLAQAFEHCQQYWPPGNRASRIAYVTHCLDSINELEPVIGVDSIAQELWVKGRKDGTIGDKFAVLLDVYEHGGISYSVSGGGMQCAFDTARGGAVWVPSDAAREEIVRRGPVYRKGEIVQFGNRYSVHLFTEPGCFTPGGSFDHWHEAFQALEAMPARCERSLLDAEYDAAREIAKKAADTYTDWCNGNCFVTVVVAYDASGEQIDYDTCGGYIGDDNAYEALKETFKEWE